MPFNTQGKSGCVPERERERRCAAPLPLSERQQVALVMQMTSSNQSGESERNGRGETPLHLAAIKGDVAAVTNFLDHGADPNTPDFAGWRPLHEACNHGWLEVARLLIARGAETNARGFQDDTPLHDAAINNHIPLLKLLLEYGADPDLKNKKGKTPADVAASPEINRLLAQRSNPSGTDVAASPEINRLLAQRSNPSESQPGEGDKSEEDPPAPTDQPQLAHAQPSSNPAPDDTMRRLPTHAKEKVSGSPRVTLRLHQAKEKKEKNKGQDSNYDNGAEVGMKEESGGVEGEEEGKEGEETETSGAAGGDRAVAQAQPEQQAVKRPTTAVAPGAGAVEQAKQPQQLSGTKRSSGDSQAQEADDSDSRRKRRKDNPDPPDSATSVESPGPKVPPLKIVLGGGSGSGGGSGGEEQTRKSGGSRLPYVVQPPPEEPSPPPQVATTPPPEPTPPITQQSVETVSVSQDQSVQQTQGQVQGQVQVQAQSQAQAQVGQDPDSKDSHKRVLRSHRSGNGSSGHSSPAGMDVGSPRSQVSPLPPDNQPTSPVAKEEEQAKEENKETPVELHPRKRKLKQPREAETSSNTPSESAGSPSSGGNAVVQPPASDLPPPANCYQLFLNIRKQIDRRRKGLFPVQPKPPQGFKDYLMNRCTYVLAGNANNRIPPPNQTPPTSVPTDMKDMFLQQEKERYRLRTQHVIEKEKLVLSVEQEILRVHGRAARALANQALPFSACTILRDEEVYSPFSAEQEEKERNARSRYNGRLFLSWLQDVDDKWEKIKEAMLLRHHNEAESLHAVQKMDWMWKLKEMQPASGAQEQPQIDDGHVPMVHVSDDFDLLPT